MAEIAKLTDAAMRARADVRNGMEERHLSVCALLHEWRAMPPTRLRNAVLRHCPPGHRNT
jgi:hypothetical protein